MFVILFSPSKEMNTSKLETKSNTLNIKYFSEILSDINSISDFSELKSREDLTTQISEINKKSKKAIELYSGLSFRQLTDLENNFYNDSLIILSSLYAYSKGFDYISPYRLDYTMKFGKKYNKKNVEVINDYISKFDLVLNIASKEFSSGIYHPNMVTINFFTGQKQISANCKRLRGKMVNYIKDHGIDYIKDFSEEDYIYDSSSSTECELIFRK